MAAWPSSSPEPIVFYGRSRNEELGLWTSGVIFPNWSFSSGGSVSNLIS